MSTRIPCSPPFTEDYRRFLSNLVIQTANYPVMGVGLRDFARRDPVLKDRRFALCPLAETA
jgi:hypothetical protein